MKLNQIDRTTVECFKMIFYGKGFSEADAEKLACALEKANRYSELALQASKEARELIGANPRWARVKTLLKRSA